MVRDLIKQDLAWAGVILVLAGAFGFWQQWDLVRLSWTGSLPALLEAQREQRRRTEFQGVKTLSLVQAYEIFQKQEASFVDARTPEEYAELHIPGAVNLPLADLEAHGSPPPAGLAPDRQLVVYCGMVSCDAALKVAEKLQSLGYQRVSVFLGGFRAWDEAGYPADTGK